MDRIISIVEEELMEVPTLSLDDWEKDPLERIGLVDILREIHQCFAENFKRTYDIRI